ncbi:TPA: hypothetical protein ACKRHV_003729 [Proteus mirabilis]|uniref:Uncharacterized protein n=1 Tax=Proteus mirabilis TaxID=584 RepID=A0AAJ0Y972_PROMI|nr:MULTISPECIES: hypothetical protein [Proteus]ARX35238.1 hypothetical protein AM402_14105 [Proteus mirabilis]EJD6316600.1 hypothetical protein [Proteus mirabilis]EJD6320881.1 hypothetical protein [Proteus mirabilis]EJD6440806.1 hypothetical protein [Proteus mirabilis]EJD6528777.1 hypothetical protein [Proteus mirabilis]
MDDKTAEILALQQIVALLLHLLPEEKRQIANTTIECIKNQNFKALMLENNPNLTGEQLREGADKLSKAYSSILKSALFFDKNLDF